MKRVIEPLWVLVTGISGTLQTRRRTTPEAKGVFFCSRFAKRAHSPARRSYTPIQRLRMNAAGAIQRSNRPQASGFGPA